MIPAENSKLTTACIAALRRSYQRTGEVFHLRKAYSTAESFASVGLYGDVPKINESLRCAMQREIMRGLAERVKPGWYRYHPHATKGPAIVKHRTIKELIRDGGKAKPLPSVIHLPSLAAKPVVGPSTAPFVPPPNAPHYTTLTVAMFKELIVGKAGTNRVVVVSPVLARYILDNHNHMNSAMQWTSVGTYATDMTANNWVYNAEPITFDFNGDMTSGQHRMEACVKSGCSFLTKMEFGLDPGIRSRRNSGKKDKPKDYLKTADWKHASIVGNAIRWLTLYRESVGKLGSRRTFAAVHYPEIAKTLDKERLENCATWAVAVHKQCKSIPEQYLCALFYLVMEKDEKRAQKFIDAWVKGSPVSIAVKCQKLFNARSNDNTRNKSGDDWQKFVTLILTWNNFYSPRRSSKADIDSWGTDQLVPVIFPDYDDDDVLG